MSQTQIKISELPQGELTDELVTIGVDDLGLSVKIPLGQIILAVQRAANDALSAIDSLEVDTSMIQNGAVTLAKTGHGIGNVINCNDLRNITIPFYDRAAAIAALIPDSKKVRGTIITWLSTDGWKTEQFIGSEWGSEDAKWKTMHPSTIVTADIANGAVTREKIADNAINASKIAPDSVDRDKIADEAVNEDKMADAAVTSAKIANGSVSGTKIANASVSLHHLNSDVLSGSLFINLDALSGSGIKTISAARTAIDAIDVAQSLKRPGLVLCFKNASGGIENWQYDGGTWSSDLSWKALGSSVSQTLINVDSLCGAPSSGYYTLATAISAILVAGTAIGVDYRMSGLIITYKDSATTWKAKQFIGSVSDFSSQQYWKDFGAGSHPYLSLERLRPYLYRVTFDSLEDDNGGDNAIGGGCSSFVQNGKLYSNLDWDYSNTADFIVRTKDFVGTSFVGGLDDGEMDDELIKQLPYRVRDGVNNYGIKVATHVLYNDWNWHGCGNQSINLTRLPFLVLTRVKSMATLTSDLSGVLNNLATSEGLDALGYLLQMIVTDGTTTYVLMPPTSANQSYVAQDITSCPKLSNFRWINNSTVTRSELQTRPTGVERWNKMPCPLEDLRFTKAYEAPTLLSEFIGLRDTTKNSTDAQLQAIYTDARALFLDRDRDGLTWQTMHSVVYSADKMEALYIQENWGDNCISSQGAGIQLNGHDLSPDASTGKVNIEAVEGVKVNGTSVIKDENGVVDIHVDTIEVDQSLDEDSTNPVQNSAVTAAIGDLQNPSFNSDVEEVEGGQQVTISTISGHQVTRFTVTGGGGGGPQISRILLSASVSSAKVKEGGHSVLSWYYNHVNEDDVTDGINGDITVIISRGAVTLHEETIYGVLPTTNAHLITLDPWLTTAGTVGVTIRAEANDGGTIQTKQYYVSVNVITLSLQLSNYSTLISKSLSGGYGDSEALSVGYVIRGSGTKEISLYIDGNDTPTTQTVTRSGTTNGQFTIPASGLASGRHVLQLVAENDGLLSESIYIDILKDGGNSPFIGIYFVTEDGTIFDSDNYLSPSIAAVQYAMSQYSYYAYDPNDVMATIQEYVGGSLNQTFSVGRTRQVYSSRYASAGTILKEYRCGNVTHSFSIVVEPSTIDIEKATANLVFELNATGRSNGESNPAIWQNNGVSTQFEGFDWQSSGWNGDALVMKNGAKAVVGYAPFNNEVDPSMNGKTIEFEFKVSNIIDQTRDIISCVSGGKGFHVTGSKASLLTGSSVQYTDEDGNLQTRIIGVEKTFAEDIDIKMAFVIGMRSRYRLMELYINGTREKADIYNNADNFVQDSPVGITFDSTAADIELRSVRVYDRAISDDEEVNNYIVDRKTVDELIEKYNENDVLEDDEYDITKILSKGKGVVHFTRPKGLDEVNSTNNKSTDFLTDVVYYSPFGAEWDFKIEGCNMRIQGTSSTKYPCKNYRIYLTKPSSKKFYRRDSAGQWVEDVDFDGYIFREGNREAPLVCLKCDYSDSSMTMNTGGSKLFNSLMKQLGYDTPPQEIDSDVRQSIDGFPVDVFCTDTEDSTNEVVYYGQYNFNHDKGKSKNIFGHVNLTDDEDVVYPFGNSIALESLNNTNLLDLFQSAGSEDSQELDEQLDELFDDGFEFNHPEDTFYSESSISDPEKESVATSQQKAGIKRLFGWIYDCIQECVTENGLDLETTNYSDSEIPKFVSNKFRVELGDYFDINHLLTYYVFTDYFMSVDQRAKNMLIRTWDYEKWYITYYDGDTALGKRNDSFLAYDYTTNRETWDSDKSKYAFEGHDSWLWCLVLANFNTELRACAKAMRNILTNSVVLNMLNVEQMGNWSERAYNKSGYIKYIRPATEGVTVIENGETHTGVIYPYIYALDGTNYSHRVHTILHRFSLLDSKYGCDAFKEDNVEMYLSRTAQQPDGTIQIRSNAPHFFDWNTKNGSHSDPKEADAGEIVTLTFSGAITVNDPIDLYGASCIDRINLSGVASSIQNGINLNEATLIREITAATQTPTSQSWWLNFERCTRLRLIDCSGHYGVKTGTSSSTEFNVMNQTRLEVLKLGGTAVRSVEIAEGTPLTELVLPATLTVLKLRYLPSLTADNLTIEGYDNITTMNFAACPGLDWVTIAESCTGLDRLRVEGIDMKDDGTVLETFKNYRGIDKDGNATSKCMLIGTIHLTKYIDDATLAEYRQAYPGLNIYQAQYTMIEFDDTINDPKNITNLDNNTTGDDYVPSGHVVKIREQLIPVTGKVVDGVFKAKRMSNSNYHLLADGAEFDYSDSHGDGNDAFMRIPHCWYKGINDFKNQKKYIAWSSNQDEPISTAKISNKKVLSSILYQSNMAVMVNSITVGESTLQSDGVLYSTPNYNVYRMSVEGMKQVRWPGINSSTIGACFLDSEGVIISKYKMEVSSLLFDFDDNIGDYIFINVPDDAKFFIFTSLATNASQYALAVDSEDIEAIEPDWVENEECLGGIYQASVDGLKNLRSISGATVRVGSGTNTTAAWTYDSDGNPTNNPSVTNYTGKDLQNMAHKRGAGYQLFDYEMSKLIAILFYSMRGNRDAGLLCGYGKSSGGVTGYRDDIGNTDSVRNVGTGNKCLGFESFFGCTWEFMDNVAVNVPSYIQAYKDHLPENINSYPIDIIWHIYDPITGTERTVNGISTSGYCIARVRNGRYCDVIASKCSSDNSAYAANYCDANYYTASRCRVVGRSSVSAGAHGGVAYASANRASSRSSTDNGSRLAFRGIIQFVDE